MSCNQNNNNNNLVLQYPARKRRRLRLLLLLLNPTAHLPCQATGNPRMWIMVSQLIPPQGLPLILRTNTNTKCHLRRRQCPNKNPIATRRQTRILFLVWTIFWKQIVQNHNNHNGFFHQHHLLKDPVIPKRQNGTRINHNHNHNHDGFYHHHRHLLKDPVIPKLRNGTQINHNDNHSGFYHHHRHLRKDPVIPKLRNGTRINHNDNHSGFYHHHHLRKDPVIPKLRNGTRIIMETTTITAITTITRVPNVTCRRGCRRPRRTFLQRRGRKKRVKLPICPPTCWQMIPNSRRPRRNE